MRVTVVAPQLKGAGAERVASAWVRMLVGAGVTVDTIELDAVSEYTPLAGRLRLRRVVAHIRRRTQVYKPDVLLAVGTYANLATLLAKAGPAVISEHSVPSILLRQEGSSGRAKLLAARAIYRTAAASISVSHPVLCDLMTTMRLPAERAYFLPNPVLRKSSTAAAESSRSVRLVWIGRFASPKDPHLFLDTLAELQRRGARVTATMNGAGPYAAEIARRVEHENLPVVVGPWLDDWTSALSDLSDSVVLVPSRIEGFGNVAVEAASAGLQVVAPSQALGIADAIVPGVTGVLALSRRPSDLADAVLRARAVHQDPVGWLRTFTEECVTPDLVKILSRAAQSSHTEGGV